MSVTGQGQGKQGLILRSAALQVHALPLGPGVDVDVCKKNLQFYFVWGASTAQSAVCWARCPA